MATIDALERYTQISSHPLHKTSKPGIVSLDIHFEKVQHSLRSNFVCAYLIIAFVVHWSKLSNMHSLGADAELLLDCLGKSQLILALLFLCTCHLLCFVHCRLTIVNYDHVTKTATRKEKVEKILNIGNEKRVFIDFSKLFT